jgi:uncharacterized 2Fe-2S/4Fe-4S cluster protein (DUF4445 family)
MRYRLKLSDHGGIREIETEEGSTILEALAAAGFGDLSAPCNGKGLCGKCRVRVAGSLSLPEHPETKLLSGAEIASGLRLACRARIRGDAEILVPVPESASILAEGIRRKFPIDPPCAAVPLVLPAPALGETDGDDESRLLHALGGLLPEGVAPLCLRFSAPAQLAAAARDPSGLTAILSEREVVAVLPGARPRRRLGIGMDLGTTTIVAYLVDLADGSRLGHRSALNDQRIFGADVISRVDAISERPGGLAELHRRTVGQIGAMARSLAENVGGTIEDILALTVAGNTIMLHILAGVSPASIPLAPFPAVFTGRRSCRPRDIGLELADSCTIMLLPSVSGYVGSDIVAGIMAVGMAEDRGVTLFLDLGTNGEMALGGAGGILCCATAAGPAFEASGIEMGMGGVSGAVDSVWIEGERLVTTTIEGSPARGLCGSGLIDAVAAFLDCGLMDYTGRVVSVQEAKSLSPGFAGLLDEDFGRVYIDKAAGIYLTKAELRKVQLAKAAVAAGIEVLLSQSGKSAADVDRVYLAGGFGSALDLKSALMIGILPEALRDRVIVAGNTAGEGAVAACLSRDRLAECDRIRKLCAYLELSSLPDFSAAFIEHMAYDSGLGRSG